MPVNPFPPVPQHSLFFYVHDPIETLINDSSRVVVAPSAMIVGPQLTRVNIRMGHNHLLLHVGFKPGGLHQLTGVPMHILLDQNYSAADLLGQEVDGILEQLRNATNWQQMVFIVEKFLLQKLSVGKSIEPFDAAITRLLSSKGNIPIETVAAAACLSLKQFERKCKERLGLPPKLFARLARFSNAYRLRESNMQISWTEIGYECGYYDQMHLIRDFKEFAGVTPRSISGDLQKTPFRLQSSIVL